jgi:hypothetical protein
VGPPPGQHSEVIAKLAVNRVVVQRPAQVVQNRAGGRERDAVEDVRRMASYRIRARGEQLPAALALPWRGPRGHIGPPMREDKDELRLPTQAPQLGRNPLRESAAQVRVCDPGSGLSGPVLPRMVRQRQHGQPQSAHRHDNPPTCAVDFGVRAHRCDARRTQMPQRVGQSVCTKIEHVIVRQARDACPDGSQGVHCARRGAEEEPLPWDESCRASLLRHTALDVHD